MSAWKWGPDGGVELDGVKYTLDPSLRDIFLGSYRAYEAHAVARKWLDQAAEAIRGGCAFYAGAESNVPALVEAIREIRAKTWTLAQNAVALMQPAGLGKALGSTVEDFLADACHVVERM